MNLRTWDQWMDAAKKIDYDVDDVDDIDSTHVTAASVTTNDTLDAL